MFDHPMFASTPSGRTDRTKPNANTNSGSSAAAPTSGVKNDLRYSRPRYFGAVLGHAKTLASGAVDSFDGAVAVLRLDALRAVGLWRASMYPHYHHDDVALRFRDAGASASASKFDPSNRAVQYVAEAVVVYPIGSLANRDRPSSKPTDWFVQPPSQSAFVTAYPPPPPQLLSGAATAVVSGVAGTASPRPFMRWLLPCGSRVAYEAASLAPELEEQFGSSVSYRMRRLKQCDFPGGSIWVDFPSVYVAALDRLRYRTVRRPAGSTRPREIIINTRPVSDLFEYEPVPEFVRRGIRPELANPPRPMTLVPPTDSDEPIRYHIARVDLSVTDFHPEFIRHIQSEVHELWVPSEYHRQLFVVKWNKFLADEAASTILGSAPTASAAGSIAASSKSVSKSLNIFIVPDATDVNLYDSRTVRPYTLELPALGLHNTWETVGTGIPSDDCVRCRVLASHVDLDVGTQIDNGWRRMVEAFITEFTAADPVMLWLVGCSNGVCTQTAMMQALLPHLCALVAASDEPERFDCTTDTGSPDLDRSKGLPPHRRLPRIVVQSRPWTDVSHAIRRMYARADVMIVPSYSDATRATVYEMMSMERPVIAAVPTSFRELLTKDTGYPLPVPDEPKVHQLTSIPSWRLPALSDFRGAMRAVYTNKRDALARGVAARQFVVKNHAIPAVVSRIRDHVTRIDHTISSVVASTTQPQSQLAAVMSATTPEEPEVQTLVRHIVGSNTEPDNSICLLATARNQPPISSTLRARQFGITASAVKSAKRIRIAFLSTYPPNPCGIATFTENLILSLTALPNSKQGPKLEFHMYVLLPDTSTYGMESNANSVTHPELDSKLASKITKVYKVRRSHVVDYTNAATQMIADGVNFLVIQHEYGLFGGHSGAYVSCLARALSPAIPIITVLHTIMETTHALQHSVLMTLYELSYRMVVMTELSRMYLEVVEGITDPSRIVVIPHGVPDQPYVEPSDSEFAASRGWSNRTIIFSTGFHNPEKGMDVMLRALPKIAKAVPTILYVIGGDPHPNCGPPCRKYSSWLNTLATELDVQPFVHFERGFFTAQKLVDLYTACHFFSALYTVHAQVSSSGTVSAALAAGRIAVTTPFTYSKEMLRDEHGVLVPFDDGTSAQVDELARTIIELCNDPDRARRVRLNAYDRARRMTWRRVAESYLRIFTSASTAPAPPPAFAVVSTQTVKSALTQTHDSGDVDPDSSPSAEDEL